ncbi:hypothetical protein LTR70_006104 [Exophiala xenobiotica]|uniref:Uncharacterized protein n=1 Tax=Lithohypha guttulata TaxID=1690604 RepID=A0ABR0K8E8_9EURO|nr:hypothetical protein LTR24_005659 [Lithohypha guttulata]KAK5316857.1 hypothetical protein LTR70_006104 [Exophiala xenobiotica]
MSFLSRLRARLSYHSRDTNATKSEGGRCGWFHFKSRTTQAPSDVSGRSTLSHAGAPPRQHKCADQIHQSHQHVVVGGRESVDLVDLEKAWFARRKSSLHRLSANNMLFKEEIRSPRPSRCFEYVPFALEVSSDGIEMELDEFSGRSKSLGAEDELAEFWALIAEIEAVDTGKHVEDEPQSADSTGCRRPLLRQKRQRDSDQLTFSTVSPKTSTRAN